MGASFAGGKQDVKFDPRIRVQNSPPRIRPLIQVPEVQNPLCRYLSLTCCSLILLSVVVLLCSFCLCWFLLFYLVSGTLFCLDSMTWSQLWLRLSHLVKHQSRNFGVFFWLDPFLGWSLFLPKHYKRWVSSHF